MQINFFKAWIIFFLVATFGGAVAGFLAGAIVGMVMGAMQSPIRSIQIGGAIAGFIVGLPISFFVFKWAVTSFILNQVSQDTTNDPETL